MSETSATTTVPTTASEAATSPASTVALTQPEMELIVTALRLLRSTLGREEAEELAEVSGLLAKLQG